MQKINLNLPEGIGTNDLDEIIMADVRGHLRNYGDWKRLSEETGISYKTIENYAYGWTRRPQQHTTTRLMEGMGLGDQLQKAYHSDTPVGRTEALAKRSPALKHAHKKQAKRLELARKTKK